MHEPRLERLRRFSLTIALILLTYSLAGISLKPDSEIAIIGLTFKVARPSLLPIGLVIASVYATLSFYYYAFMLKKSPYRIRRDILDSLSSHEPKFQPGKEIPTYFGATKFETSISSGDRREIESVSRVFPEAF